MADVNKVLTLVDMVGSESKFKAYKSAVEKTIPKGMDFGRYWQMFVQIMQSWYNNPKVTDKNSILTCLFNAAKLSLNPDPVFGQIYFIPYKGVLTYQIGYKGMIRLSLNTKEVVGIASGLVYEKDQWDYFLDEKGTHFLWRPDLKAESKKMRGKELFGFSCFTHANGFQSYHIMETYHIDEIKKLVLARMGASSSPWKDDLFELEMRKKTVIRRHWKTEPMSAEIARIIDHEENTERGEVKKENVPELAGIVEGMVKDFEEPENVSLTPEQQAFADNLK
jgi:recombination protein RecT